MNNQLHSAIPPSIHTEIMRRLAKVEETEGVKILLAVESGSRAWGFASPDSDYDVRFIYVRDTNWYLSVNLEDQRDVIEYPIVDEIDLNGWDIRKALQLFARSNPAFIEWIQSPIVYIDTFGFAEKARTLLPSIYNPLKGIYHYRAMAANNHRQFLYGTQVKQKKYFYVLRALLGVKWIEQFGVAPPIEFATLLATIMPLIANNTALLADINALLERKKSMPELGLSAPIASIHNFIDAEMQRLENIATEAPEKQTVMPILNDWFRDILKVTSNGAI